MKCDLCHQTSRHYAWNPKLEKNQSMCVYHYIKIKGTNRCADCDKKFTKLKQCYICKEFSQTKEHHISYLPQIIINICNGCHNKIHRGNLKQFLPNKRMMNIFYSKKGSLYTWHHGLMHIRKLTPLEMAIRKEMLKTKEVLE